MLSEPRTISLLTELIHLPVVHVPEKLREVYNEVCRTCGYENFTRIPGGARIERRDAEGEGFSHLSFVGDRIQLTEDHTGVSVDQFGKKVLAALTAALPALGIPIILGQHTTIRMTATPNSFRSASEYLARSLFKIRPEDLGPLGRPTSVFGLRLVFPPTSEHPQNYNVRIECYVRDGRSLYIENVGTFKQPIQPAGIDQVDRNLQMSSDFLVEHVIKFLSSFDRKESDQ
ncbi:MAG TPA: hypothetical protein VMT52_16775 [Planctomycetota bacterium]|nr:hypothetical protein [Planctomycetota bacterium]